MGISILDIWHDFDGIKGDMRYYGFLDLCDNVLKFHQFIPLGYDFNDYDPDKYDEDGY